MKEVFAFPTDLWMVGCDAGVPDLPEEACWRTGMLLHLRTALYTAAVVRGTLGGAVRVPIPSFVGVPLPLLCLVSGGRGIG